MTLDRRDFMQFVASVTAASAIPVHPVEAETSQQVRVATGLLAMWQSTAWLGAEAGIFRKYSIDLSVPAIAVGGPQAAAGVIRGDFEFAHTGVLPVADEVLKGNDIVILATPTSEFPNQFVMTRKEITELGQLAGRRVGVLSETGQTSLATRITIEKAGATATYLPLVRFDRIFAALAAGEIDAGALPVDLRFVGASRYGWNAFPIYEFGTPSIFASTRRLIASNRELVGRVMRGFVETIHLFKTQPDLVVPLLQRYLNVADRKAAEDLYAYHVPVFQKVPKPLLGNLQNVRDVLARKYPAAVSLKESDIADASFIEELVHEGFIEHLYASDTK
ncbi:ABC transporter substrate-binding protein [Bradyrhizobium septentrionale]|uniref:ABC transporter substrate-binding protein n=1 Tax=Bradyrhizobium septentrionale TaxID=1404411 RepID=A0A973VXB4_9BRAD|nr:ABC transporter substrate-binding protein [Bradyrhizobium septentrionale]UGY12146.1 ABC transporter substrate-binding protein [Bradyrhizobium septentrionale]